MTSGMIARTVHADEGDNKKINLPCRRALNGTKIGGGQAMDFEAIVLVVMLTFDRV